MKLWQKKPVPELFVEPEGMVADRIVENHEWDGDAWLGHVAFGSSGWFHPVRTDDSGNELGPDLEVKLIHNTKTGRWHRATPEHRDHKSHWVEKHPQGREHDLEVEG